MSCRQIGMGACKTHLLIAPKTREAVLVDPVLQRAAEHLALLRGEGLKLAAVVDTHTHADHLSAGAELRELTGAAYIMHEATRCRAVSRRVSDGETLGVGDLKVSFLHTPGHTADSVSLLTPDTLLSGDFLFLGSYGAGRLDLPGGDPGAHFDSLKKLDALPDALEVMPAHDYQGLERGTLGAERRVNPVLTPRGREEYLRYWAGKTFSDSSWMGPVVAANIRGERDPRAVLIPETGAACACASGPAEHAALPQISAPELQGLIAQGRRGLVLLDVRTPEEYAGELGHLPGAVLIPIDELPSRLSEVPPGEVAVICRSGGRASRAAAMLKAAGRDRLWVLTGGMLAWNGAGLPKA